jgi:hypothetical protein
MCTVLLPPGVNPIAAKYIYIKSCIARVVQGMYSVESQRTKTISLFASIFARKLENIGRDIILQLHENLSKSESFFFLPTDESRDVDATLQLLLLFIC